MPLDFPSSPTNGQSYAGYVYDSSLPGWRNINSDFGVQSLNTMGLKNVVPSSVSVGSGSATVNANGTVSFSGATSVKLNGVFTSTYKSYRVVISEVRTTAVGAVILRYVTGGTTNSSAAYWYGGVYGASNNTSGAVAAQSATSILVGSHDAISSNFHFSSVIDIHSPASTQLTNANIQTTSYVNGTLGFVGYSHGADFNGLQSFDGLEISENAGNFTGNITVYGYSH